jgi:lipopolysaccharide transport system ATP-binding protein
LIVDEVLAVGDAEFQKKCLGRMKDVSTNDGRTILFVSHSMAAVKNICNTGLLLKNGRLDLLGSSDDVVNYYFSNFIQSNSESKVDLTEAKRLYDHTRYIEYQAASFINPVENNFYSIKDDISVLLRLKSNIDCEAFRVSFSVNRPDESIVGVFFSQEIFSAKKGQVQEVELIIKDHQLAKGQYYLCFAVGIGNEIEGITEYDFVNQVLFFEIAYKDIEKSQMITLWPSEWGNTNFQYVEARVV